MKNTFDDEDDFAWATNFSKHMTKFGEKMTKFGEKMADMGCKSGSYMFNCFDNDDFAVDGDKTSVITRNGATTIKKGDTKVVIDKDCNITINGKKAVTLDESCYNKTAAECNAEKTTIKVPSDAKVHKDLESDMEVISRGELKRVIYENSIKFEKIYWNIGLASVMSCSLAILISSLICK